VDGRLGDRLSVTIISSLSGEDEADLLKAPAAANNASAVSPVREQYESAALESQIQPEQSPVEARALEETITFEEPVAAETDPRVSSEPPETSTHNDEPEHAVTQQEKSVTWTEEKEPIEKPVMPAKQEVLQFEPVTRGRFEKSEPTIIEGEDLDVPTYLRKRVKVK